MRKTVILLLIVLCTILIFLSLKNNNSAIPNEDAKYIWIDEEGVTDEEKQNNWVYFRKEVELKNIDDLENAIAKISVDSKYWLYINGEMVMRDGELKRGQNPSSIYYDEIDIKDFLKKGKNTIALLVWYFGDISFSHVSSNQGVMLFDAKVGNYNIVSDETWKAIKSPAYLKDDLILEDRLSEENIYYDANLEILNWYASDFDDSKWKNAKVYGNPNDETWGELIKRDIPFFKYGELKEYENFEEYKNKIFDEDKLLKLKLPANIQFTPYLKIESEANEKVYICQTEDILESGVAHKTTYITKNGEQEFESLSWINGDYVYYYIPSGVKIISLSYRETGYDIQSFGKFISNDEFLNKLWQKSLNSVYVNMRDYYMDCPDRERANWWGDCSIEMESAIYAFDPNANLLYEKCVNTMLGWKQGTILMTVNPPTRANLHAPIQMLLGICSMYDYYQYTGNIEFLEKIYNPIKEYLNNWTINEDNNLITLNNYYAIFNWADSIGHTDYAVDENMWYYYALKNFYEIAKILNKKDLDEIESKLETLELGINNIYWTDEGYKQKDNDYIDQRANAVAILSGLAREEKYEIILPVLINNTDNSPLMEKYVLEALCKIGKIEEAQERIKYKYEEMINDDTSTLWEFWNINSGSKNHGWSAGSLIIMSKYFAGISPLKPGFEEVEIVPKFGKLNSIETITNTVKGQIVANFDKTDDLIKISLNVPTKTLIAIPKVGENTTIYSNNNIIYKNNEPLITNFHKEDESYIYYYMEKGTYEIIATNKDEALNIEK